MIKYKMHYAINNKDWICVRCWWVCKRISKYCLTCRKEKDMELNMKQRYKRKNKTKRMQNRFDEIYRLHIQGDSLKWLMTKF